MLEKAGTQKCICALSKMRAGGYWSVILDKVFPQFGNGLAPEKFPSPPVYNLTDRTQVSNTSQWC